MAYKEIDELSYNLEDIQGEAAISEMTAFNGIKSNC